AAFGDWQLAGRKIQGWSGQEIAAFCERYSIGWVITWSRASRWKGEPGPLSTDRFAELPFCELVATLPRYSSRPDESNYFVFRVRREHTFFERGAGRVTARDYNRIALADLRPDRAGELVLRYHWQNGLAAEPPVKLERANEPGDPVGFIRIRTDEPLGELVLTNVYR